MMDMDIFQLFFNYLEATMQENKINAQCKKLDLSDKQRKVIMQWIDAIQAQESAYTAVGSGWVYNAVFPVDGTCRLIRTKRKSAVFHDFLRT